MNLNLQQFGGRGSSSGSLSSKLPPSSAYRINENLPALTGTEKQIEWAKKIRLAEARSLSVYAVTMTSKGTRSGFYEIAVQGKQAIINDIKNSPLVKSTSGKVKQEKINNAVAAYNDLANRIARFNNIFQNHTSATYWIDNRQGTLKNPHGNKFKNIIDGK